MQVNDNSREVDMRSELLKTEVSILLILRYVVEIVHIFDSYVKLRLVNKLDLVQKLEAHLGLHH
jgi:hypothetical protein